MRILVALCLFLAGPALALTPAAVEKAAGQAHGGLRTVVKKLASKKLAGRDNASDQSLAAQTWLIRKLRRGDLQRITAVVQAAQSDLELFSPADQTMLMNARTLLEGLVADGPDAFESPGDVGTPLGTSIGLADALRRVPCQKF
jgi:hypothetical protein